MHGGYVSEARAREVYGVALAEGGQVDGAATERLGKAARARTAREHRATGHPAALPGGARRAAGAAMIVASSGRSCRGSS